MKVGDLVRLQFGKGWYSEGIVLDVSSPPRASWRGGTEPSLFIVKYLDHDGRIQYFDAPNRYCYEILSES